MNKKNYISLAKKTANVQVNELKGQLEFKEASKKFDIDAMPSEFGGIGAPPPVG